MTTPGRRTGQAGARRTARLLGVAGVAGAALTVTLISAAVPPSLAPTGSASQGSGSPSAAHNAGHDCAIAPFTDRMRIPSTHRPSVDCAFTNGLTDGRGNGTFDPAGAVTRGQLAAFVVRALEAAAVPLPPASTSFSDTPGTTHADVIHRLASAGIVRGHGDGTFRPDATVTRDQIAGYMLGALALALDVPVEDLRGDDAAFTDTSGNVHEDAIEGALDAGLVAGQTSSTYEPRAQTRRDQMATLLVRLLDEARQRLGVEPPEPVDALPAPALPDPHDPGAELRAFWVDAFNPGLYDPGEAADLVAEAAATNHNAIVVQVVRRGDCFCNDALPPRTQAAIAPPPYDPLATIVDAARDAGLEVHAWMNVATLWSASQPPADPDHPFNRHGPATSDPWTSVRADGEHGAGVGTWYLDPGHPDAVRFVVDTARSLVSAYDLDGVNLDYIRYPDHNLAAGTASWGYNPVALDRFRAHTGHRGVPAATDETWTQWRREQLTALVREVYLGVYEADPQARVSVNTVAYGNAPSAAGGWERTQTYREVLQDVDWWMREGIVDLNVVMNYKREHTGDQGGDYRQWAAFTADNQHARQAAVGSALYLNDIPASVGQIRSALAPTAAGNRVAGWVGYSYNAADRAAAEGDRPAAASRSALRTALTTDSPDGADPVFAEARPAPTMPWKTAPTRGHLQGTALAPDGRPLDGAVLTARRGTETATATVGGTGHFGFVDLAPGEWAIRIPGDDATVTVRPGALATLELGS